MGREQRASERQRREILQAVPWEIIRKQRRCTGMGSSSERESWNEVSAGIQSHIPPRLRQAHFVVPCPSIDISVGIVP